MPRRCMSASSTRPAKRWFTRTSEPARLVPEAIGPYREGLVVAVECMFAWYWLADLCSRENIPFVLGHALYMKAIHGGKTKNDKIDRHKIALLLRGGMMPMAYAYPPHASHPRLAAAPHATGPHAGRSLAHIQNTVSQYNLPPLAKKLIFAANREGVAEQFAEASTHAAIEADLALIAAR